MTEEIDCGQLEVEEANKVTVEDNGHLESEGAEGLTVEECLKSSKVQECQREIVWKVPDEICRDMQILRGTLENMEKFYSEQSAISHVALEAQERRIHQLELEIESLKQAQGIYCSPKALHLPSPKTKQALIHSENSSPKSIVSISCINKSQQLILPQDIIGTNINLLHSSTKAGRLAVKLARESYFGLDEIEMSQNTVSSLSKSKLNAIKDQLFTVYRYDDLVEFEPIWQKCLIAIGKACQALFHYNQVLHSASYKFIHGCK